MFEVRDRGEDSFRMRDEGKTTLNFEPMLPVEIWIESGGVEQRMQTPIRREALVAGCACDPPSGQTALNGDVYALVQPVVSHSCASLDCHGREARPLRIYAVNGLRRSGDLRGEGVTQEELHLDADAFEAIDPEPTRLHIVLSKPLAVRAGGLFHDGGDLWPDPSHPEHRCIEAWLTETPADIACAEAAPPDPP